jgi:hypothetical protein
MRVRHAELRNVYGRAANHGGFTIVPADVVLTGKMFDSSFPLNELPGNRIPPVLRVPVANGFDVAWVRARLPLAFGCTPEPTELEKAFLAQGFVAVPDGAEVGIPFEASDYYGRTSLTFSESEVDEEMKARVADAFWSVLLADPDELDDFSGRFYHIGAGVTLTYGCHHDEPFRQEIEEDDDDDDE